MYIHYSNPWQNYNFCTYYLEMCKNYMCNCVYMSLLNFIRIFRGMLLNYGNLIIKSKNDKHYMNHLKTTFIEYYTVMFSIYSVLNRSDSLGYIKHVSV